MRSLVSDDFAPILVLFAGIVLILIGLGLGTFNGVLFSAIPPNLSPPVNQVAQLETWGFIVAGLVVAGFGVLMMFAGGSSQ